MANKLLGVIAMSAVIYLIILVTHSQLEIVDQDQYSYELWPGCVLVGSIAVRLDRTSQFHKPLRPIYLQYVHVQSEHLALIRLYTQFVRELIAYPSPCNLSY